MLSDKKKQVYRVCRTWVSLGLEEHSLLPFFDADILRKAVPVRRTGRFLACLLAGRTVGEKRQDAEMDSPAGWWWWWWWCLAFGTSTPRICSVASLSVCVRACLSYLLRRTDRIRGVSPPSRPHASGFTLPVRGFSVRCEHPHPRLACLSTFIYLFSPHHLPPCGGECPLPADVAHWRGGYVTADEAVIWRGC